jgi:hypothetical protein
MEAEQLHQHAAGHIEVRASGRRLKAVSDSDCAAADEADQEKHRAHAVHPFPGILQA